MKFRPAAVQFKELLEFSRTEWGWAEQSGGSTFEPWASGIQP